MDRRGFLGLLGAGAGLAAWPLRGARGAEPPAPGAEGAGGSVMDAVSRYVAESGERALPPRVVEKAKHHLLDTLTAMASGAALEAGRLAVAFAGGLGDSDEAQVVGAGFARSAIDAALANGISAHADETDDSHEASGTHPGCAVVPAALAIAEREGASGARLLRAVVAGYDIGCRMPPALGHWLRGHASYGIGGCFGAMAAGASLLGLDEQQVRYACDYASQQASGVGYWRRDPRHLEKAFVFGGMPARNGATAALLAADGFTGLDDCFRGELNFFEVFGNRPQPEVLAAELGQRFEIEATTLKKHPVGSPLQAPLEALSMLMAEHGLAADDVAALRVRLPRTALVADNPMPGVNLPYILAVTLLDGRLDFDAAHSHARMRDPAVLALRGRIELVEDPDLRTRETVRTGAMEVTTRGGRRLSQHVRHVPGTPARPMGRDDVEAKCRALLVPALGAARTDALVDALWRLEELDDVRALRPLLAA